jgi:hypothetical protein
LYGHSYGAVCALGAATLTRNLQRLFLYEPGFQGVVLTPDDVLGRLDELVAAGSYDAALEHAYRFGVGMSADEVAQMRALPSWLARVPAAPTIPREFRTAAGLPFDAAAVADLRVPTVLLLGDQSTSGQKAVVAAVHGALVSELVVLPNSSPTPSSTTTPSRLSPDDTSTLTTPKVRRPTMKRSTVRHSRALRRRMRGVAGTITVSVALAAAPAEAAPMEHYQRTAC